MDVPALTRETALLAPRWPQVQLVVIFGSVARDDARPDSDVDVGVLGGAFWDQLDVGSEIARLTRREPHAVDLAAASDWLRFQVAREGVMLYERDPGGWARFRAESAVRYFDLGPIMALCAEGVRRRLLRESEARLRG
jgi:predicted nucleotidyltransferase